MKPNGNKIGIKIKLIVLIISTLIPVISLAAIDRVNVSNLSSEANGYSWTPAVSGDGRYVAFQSYATNLDPLATSGQGEVFRYDRTTDTIELVSVNNVSAESNGESGYYGIDISEDGNLVVFQSYATDLVAGGTTFSNVFIRNMTTGTTTLVSADSAGTGGDSDSQYPDISTNGRYVAFSSDATNLVAGDTNGLSDVFVKDLNTSITERVSLTDSDLESTGSSGSFVQQAISSDGQFVAFQSDSTDLVAGDTNARTDIFVRDRVANTTERISVDSSEIESNHSSISNNLAISDDGNIVVFESFASNLVAGDTNGSFDIFARDRAAGVTELISQDGSGNIGNSSSQYPDVSGDGNFISFESYSSNLIAGDTEGNADIFVYKRDTDEVARISEDTGSVGGNGDSAFNWQAMSNDGSIIAFGSYASNLVAGDTNVDSDIFAADNPLAAIVDTTPPAAPINVTAVADGDSINLDWDDNTEGDLEDYDIYRSNLIGGPYSVLANNVSSSDFDDTTAVPGTTYYFVITASDTTGNESSNSSEVSATVSASAGNPASGGRLLNNFDKSPKSDNVEKGLLCHYPQGNMSNPRLIRAAQSKGHLSNHQGDFIIENLDDIERCTGDKDSEVNRNDADTDSCAGDSSLDPDGDCNDGGDYTAPENGSEGNNGIDDDGDGAIDDTYDDPDGRLDDGGDYANPDGYRASNQLEVMNLSSGNFEISGKPDEQFINLDGSSVTQQDCPYFVSYSSLGSSGSEILKVQNFLNQYLGISISLNGIFDTPTLAATKVFQVLLAKDILTPWGLTQPTGRVYKTTQGVMNEIIGCETESRFLEGVDKIHTFDNDEIFGSFKGTLHI